MKYLCYFSNSLNEFFERKKKKEKYLSSRGNFEIKIFSFPLSGRKQRHDELFPFFPTLKVTASKSNDLIYLK